MQGPEVMIKQADNQKTDNTCPCPNQLRTTCVSHKAHMPRENGQQNKQSDNSKFGEYQEINIMYGMNFPNRRIVMKTLKAFHKLP